ncbi:hypothetical protein D9M69_459300 [compost metagenome]
MKSKAPARRAPMAVSISAKAVMRITSPIKPDSRSVCSHSRPVFPGRLISRMIRSKWLRPTSVAASSTLPAAATDPQRLSSARLRKLRIPSSSSTIRMEFCFHRVFSKESAVLISEVPLELSVLLFDIDGIT